MGKIRPANSRATRAHGNAKKWKCSSTSNPETTKFRSRCNLVTGVMKPSQKEPSKREKRRQKKEAMRRMKQELQERQQKQDNQEPSATASKNNKKPNPMKLKPNSKKKPAMVECSSDSTSSDEDLDDDLE